jgi:uncharacterized membrane protein YfcA
MDYTQLSLISFAIALVAFLYSSVGHGGASGYIAVMALCGFASELIKPTALVLNILVASIGTFQFWRAGYFSWNLFWPFALLSVPAAFVGGFMLFSAVRLFFRSSDPLEVSPPSKLISFGVGTGIGLLSGLTGTGGGIFLTPLLLFRRWAHTRSAAAVSALFILVNSVAGLVGYFSSGQSIPSFAWVLALPAIVGGMFGSQLGSHCFPVRTVSMLLSLVLILAGSKLIFTR